MFRRFLLLELFARLFRFRFKFQVLDDMFGSLRHYVADIVKALAPCAACNLVKISRGQNSRLVTTVLAELRKQNRSNRHIHAHAQRIGTANDLEQTLLRKFFAENAILGQKSRMVQTDTLL